MYKSISAREHALQLLIQLDKGGLFVDHALEEYYRQADVSTADKAQIAEFVNGTIRWRGRIDWVLAHFLQQHWKKLPIAIRQILRIAVYQCDETTQIPIELVVNESVELAKKYGHIGTTKLTNAVLRNIVRHRGDMPYPDLAEHPTAHIAIRYSHPEWLVERWRGLFADDRVIRICEANNRRPTLFLRANRLKTELPHLQTVLAEEGVMTTPVEEMSTQFLQVTNTNTNIFETKAFKQGLFQPQNPTAGWVIKLAKPEPGMKILDLCAAPGGKTGDMAESVQDRAVIIANDRVLQKVKQMALNFKRLGYRQAFPVVGDGCALGPGQLFDLILVDAPCSGTGVLRRRSDARWRKQAADFRTLPILQKALLQAAANMVRPGGALVYSTCSIDPAENDEVISAFLNSKPQFSIEPATETILPHHVDKGCLRVFPDVNGNDGGYAVRLRRIVK